MTVTFHKFPNQSDFDQKMQETEIEYLENSEVAQKIICRKLRWITILNYFNNN